MVSLLICAIIFEVVLRLFTPPAIFHPGLSFNPHNKMVLDVELYGVGDTVYYSTNKWGMRGDPIPSEWDSKRSIVIIGGSTTQCMYLSDDKTWPAQLQNCLLSADTSIIVQNAGLDGHSTRGHLLLMEKVIPKIKPDMVIFLIGVNDLGHSLNEERFILGNPYEQTSIAYNLFTYSRLAQFIYTWQQILINKAPVVEKTKYGQPNGYAGKPLLQKSPLPDSLESILPSLREFEENIVELHKRAREESVEILFLTQPMLFDSTSEWDSIEGRSYWLGKQELVISAATYWRMMSIFNRHLVRVCDSLNVPCFDLASQIPHRQQYFYDHVHFNEAGAAFVAEKVCQFITEGD